MENNPITSPVIVKISENAAQLLVKMIAIGGYGVYAPKRDDYLPLVLGGLAEMDWQSNYYAATKKGLEYTGGDVVITNQHADWYGINANGNRRFLYEHSHLIR